MPSFFPGMGIPVLKIRRSRDRLIFNMRIHIMVRGNLYIETAPNWSKRQGLNNKIAYTVFYNWWLDGICFRRMWPKFTKDLCTFMFLFVKFSMVAYQLILHIFNPDYTFTWKMDHTIISAPGKHEGRIRLNISTNLQLAMHNQRNNQQQSLMHTLWHILYNISRPNAAKMRQ